MSPGRRWPRQQRDGSGQPVPVNLLPTNCCQYIAMHPGNYATIANYLEMELRYMDAGE
jgi:hypothetical protein